MKLHQPKNVLVRLLYNFFPLNLIVCFSYLFHILFFFLLRAPSLLSFPYPAAALETLHPFPALPSLFLLPFLTCFLLQLGLLYTYTSFLIFSSFPRFFFLRQPNLFSPDFLFIPSSYSSGHFRLPFFLSPNFPPHPRLSF